MCEELQHKLRQMRLYALLTEKHCQKPWMETAEAILAGGADGLQIREKDLSDRELLYRCQWLRALTKRCSVLFFVNDRADIAKVVGADGIHVGQDDLPPDKVRRIIGPDMLIGMSTHSIKQAEQAVEMPIDYVAAGPVYPTKTKGYAEGGGANLVGRISDAVDLPTVAVGGIETQNVADMVEAGASAVAVCGGLCRSSKPAAAARAFKDAFEKAGE
ncbi:MAG: thiamine phosphate synthase [Candidatus Brocadiia bacterium]